MEIALVLVALVVLVLVGAGLADRIGMPSPLLLIALGIGCSYLPFAPEVVLTPDLVLLGLLPPLLYAAALQTSLVDFNAHRRPILLLSVGLVVFTTVGVAVVVHALIPDLSWWASFALGAVVAPPDAVAATTIARRIGLPRSVVTILEGESLLNDATALVALRTAIAAGAGAAALSAGEIALDFLIAAGGGALVGGGLFLLVAYVRKHQIDPLTDVAISLVTPFAAFVAAEEIHASGVIAVVVAGLLLGHNAPVLQTARSRISESTNWQTIAFLLENSVFLLIGLQARRILEDLGQSGLSTGRVVVVAAATLATVIALRLVWVATSRLLLVRPGPGGHDRPWPNVIVVGWAGMRGVVTLAAAFVIPASTPHREALLVVAFAVVAGTLFIQGLTLPWLARRLRVPAPDRAADALARASVLQRASVAGMAELEREQAELGGADPDGVFATIRQRLDQRNYAAWERLGTVAGAETPSDRHTRVRLAMINAERAEVLRIRSQGRVASEVIAEVLEQLDVEESILDVTSHHDEIDGAVEGPAAPGSLCEHLEALAAVAPVSADAEETLACHQCLNEGLTWVALRRCLTCGEVACCDSSRGQHAMQHFHATTHPVVQSAEPRETWRWCFVHHDTG